MNTLELTWFIFDMTGTIAFAVSGAVVGISRRMDIFGITVLAVLTAVGGGMVRDVLVGIFPPTVLKEGTGLIVAVITALLVAAVYTRYHISGRGKRRFLFFFNVSDTIGLASFTVTGAVTGLYQMPQYHYVLPIMLGLITAVGGGMLRDLMGQRMPVVLRSDIYAVASLVGGLCLCLTWFFVSPDFAPVVGFTVTIVLRAMALHYGWQLPRPSSPIIRHKNH